MSSRLSNFKTFNSILGQGSLALCSTILIYSVFINLVILGYIYELDHHKAIS